MAREVREGIIGKGGGDPAKETSVEGCVNGGVGCWC